MSGGATSSAPTAWVDWLIDRPDLGHYDIM